MAALGLLETTPVSFEASEGIDNAGALLMIPFLNAAGLFSFRRHFSELAKGYYYIEIIILFVSLMYLCRIKNPEKLKQISPGEFGRLLGLDRIPEAKCLRSKLKAISDQGKSKEWGMELANEWSHSVGDEFYYVDGHVQVYTGHKANLGKKHSARQKLCVPGMQEFWINDSFGAPYFYVTGDLNEKLIEMLTDHIIPTIDSKISHSVREEELFRDPLLPCFTLVFDREGYSPAFFSALWDNYRAAVVTYRKNVKDSWPERDFAPYEINLSKEAETMLLAEKQSVISGHPMREIRKLCEGGHQTAIITTNYKLTIDEIALNMFSRWRQENYFAYMRREYDFDKLVQYAVEEIDSSMEVVNPEYNNLSYHIKKTREKTARRQAILYSLVEQNVASGLEESDEFLKKQSKVKEELNELKAIERELIEKRKKHPYKIKIGDMPEEFRYNRLHQESKHFINIIKMICYRAEGAAANIIAPYYKRSLDEKRELIKCFIKARGNIIPDYEANTLTVSLYSMANPRMNAPLEKLAVLLNETETIYPSTNLKLIFNIAKL